MRSRTLSLLASFVVVCSLTGALSGCSTADNPPPAKPTEAPPPPAAKETQPHKTQEGKTYGGNDMYKKIVDGTHQMSAGMPESFNVLVKEIRSLAIDMELEER